MLRHPAVLLTSIVLVAGCTGDRPSEPAPETGTAPATDTTGPRDTPSPTPTGAAPTATDDPMADTRTCEADRYTVAHPVDWHTNDTDVLDEPCRVFHPSSIEIEAGTELGFQWAAVLRVEDVAFDRASATDTGYTVLDQRETTVAGRRAAVAEMRADEDAPLVPSGTRVYRWTVELDADSVLIASTHDIGELDYEQEKQVLDAMMATLEVDPPATAQPAAKA